MAEMPELVELHQEWESKGVRVQTVSLDLVQGERDTPEAIAEFAAAREFDLPILAFDGDLAALAETYQLSGGIPVTLAIAADGTVVERIEGPADRAHFEGMIERALDASR